jgi:hypothetical protein
MTKGNATRTALALFALGLLATAAVLPGSSAVPSPMALPTEAEMRASLTKAADWTLKVTLSDGQLLPPMGSPSWEVTSPGRMCLNGLVLLRAYQATGTASYLLRAKACADLAKKNIAAGRAYVAERTAVLPSEASSAFINVQQGKIDDAYQASFAGPVTFQLWQATTGLLFLTEMYRETGNMSYINDALVIDRFVHSHLALGGDPAAGMVESTSLSDAGEWTQSGIDSTVEHAVLLSAIRAGRQDLPFLYEDRIPLFNYLATQSKPDGSYDDRTTYPGQMGTSETQHAIMVPAMLELGAEKRARDLAAWVLGMQATNGSFSCQHDMDWYGDTSYAVLGLLPIGEVDAGGRGIAWLIGGQQADGSWPILPGHPTWASIMYSTEWAALAVAEGLRNWNLQVTAASLTADPIWEGSPQRVVGFTVNATVANQGLATVRGALVRAYDGEVALGRIMDVVSVDVPALGAVETSLEFRPSVPGPHGVNISVVAPKGGEFRLGDNVASINVNVNRDPTGVITSPDEGTLFGFQAIIDFKVDSVDDLDHDAASFEWTDNVTGVLSSESQFTRVLPPGDHRASLHIKDGHGPGTWLVVNFSVRQNLAPTVRITTPSDGERYFDYQDIPLNASATSDPEGQVLTFTWMSDATGLIGQGMSIQSRLSPGEHTVTVWVDDGWANVSKSVVVEVMETFPPVVVITQPEDGTEYVVTSRVRFDGSQTTDPDSEFLEYSWTSNIDGLLSERTTFLAFLSVGRHTLTLTVTDGNYHITSVVHITVVDNHVPTSVITSPANEASYYSDQTVELNGSLSSDPEDPLSYFWVSDREGVLGTDPVINLQLHRGTHKLTLWVDDGHGHNVSSSVAVTILNLGPTARISTPTQGLQVYTDVDVEFLSAGSGDPEGDRLTYSWEIRAGAGLWVPFATEASATRVFEKASDYSVRLTVSDGALSNSTEVEFRVAKKAEGDDGPGFGGAMAVAGMAAVAAVALAAASRRRKG